MESERLKYSTGWVVQLTGRLNLCSRILDLAVADLASRARRMADMTNFCLGAVTGACGSGVKIVGTRSRRDPRQSSSKSVVMDRSGS